MEQIDDIFKIDKKFKKNKIIAKDELFSKKTSLLVNKVILNCQLVCENTNINEYIDNNYIYKSLSIFYITLRDKTILKTVLTNLTKKILSPAFYIFIYNNEISIVFTKFKVNQKDKNKNIVEEQETICIKNINNISQLEQKILEKFNFTQLSNIRNFYNLYMYFINWAVVYNLSNELKLDFEQHFHQKNELILANNKITKLKQEIKALYVGFEKMTCSNKNNITNKIKNITNEINKIISKFNF